MPTCVCLPNSSIVSDLVEEDNLLDDIFRDLSGLQDRRNPSNEAGNEASRRDRTSRDEPGTSNPRRLRRVRRTNTGGGTGGGIITSGPSPPARYLHFNIPEQQGNDHFHTLHGYVLKSFFFI